MRNGGVTLLELIVTITLVGIMSVLAFPVMNYLQSSRTRLAGSQIASDLNYSRDYAQSTGRRTWAIFDSSSESWTLLSEDPANPGRSNAVAMTHPATGGQFTQQIGDGEYEGIEVVSVNIDGGSEVGFDWLGRPLNESGNELAGRGEIILSDNFQVTIEPGTGHVQAIAP